MQIHNNVKWFNTNILYIKFTKKKYKILDIKAVLFLQIINSSLRFHLSVPLSSLFPFS